MAVTLKPGWSKPSTILFASEIPANEKVLGFAAAQAKEFGAQLILFHAYDTMVVAASDASGVVYYDRAATARAEKQHLEPLAEKIRADGVDCEIVVRPGLVADQILQFLRERPVDRIVMGTHSPGPIGKMLVGSVAEAVLRTAPVPVYIVGPDAPDARYKSYETRTILCALSMGETSYAVAALASAVAAQEDAKLILQHVIKPQERSEVLAGRTLEDFEAEMLAMVPEDLRGVLSVQAVVVPGDPTEELLYQGRALEADLIIVGAQGASAFAALTRQGVVYKTLAHAHCPVLTVSKAMLEVAGVKIAKHHPTEEYIAGVF